MKTLILDYSKWRCGVYGNYQLGKGNTLLNNIEGFQCCLGQFSLQLNKNLTKDMLISLGEPNDLDVLVETLTRIGDYNDFENTDLSDKAININDAELTTPQEKIVLLKELFEKEGYSITVINQN